MRFIFKLLIGLIIFNAFLFLFSTNFGMVDSGGEDIVGSGASGFDINSSGFAYGVITTGGGIFIVGIIATILTKNPVWTGAGALMGLIFSLWTGTTTTIGSLLAGYDEALYLWTIISVVTGVIATIAVVEIFTGRSVDD